jgi:SAM-dependent methyltransferase
MARTEPFDTHAKQYDHWFETHPAAFESELAALRMALPASGHGVEIGVGTGRFAAALGVPLGIDPSLPMRTLAQNRGIETLEGVAEALPLDDASMDYALMVTTICYLTDIDAGFSEVHRVLVPRGAFVVGFLDRESSLGRLLADAKQQSVFYRWATLHAAFDVENQLVKSGFDVAAAYQTLFSDPETMSTPDPVRNGFGLGGFVVFQCKKPASDTFLAPIRTRPQP